MPSAQLSSPLVFSTKNRWILDPGQPSSARSWPIGRDPVVPDQISWISANRPRSKSSPAKNSRISTNRLGTGHSPAGSRPTGWELAIPQPDPGQFIPARWAESGWLVWIRQFPCQKRLNLGQLVRNAREGYYWKGTM